MRKVVILGTGGTIAGTGNDPERSWQYVAAQRSVSELIEAVPQLAAWPIEAHQVAQIDSKDMTWEVWRQLAHVLREVLAREDVGSVVITHGTDTLEESAWMLHALHDGAKPVVLTAAMRPATAVDADGPGNLLDAVEVAARAAEADQGGVVAVMAGRIWAGRDVRKAHSHAIDAFDGGGAAPLALKASNAWGAVGVWPHSLGAGWGVLDLNPPRVEIVCSHVDADGWLVEAMLARGGLAGLVVAATGHGTIHDGLKAAVLKAESQGVKVWVSSRVARGGVESREGDGFQAAGALTAAQARIALQLHLMGADSTSVPST